MNKTHEYVIDSELDLVLEREVDVPPESVWAAWTTPEKLVKWFAPAPWSTAECEIDLRPGGKFLTVMVSPEGERFPGEGCYLEVSPNEKLVWTDALKPGYRPSGEPFFTAILLFERTGKGTLYTVIARHASAEDRKKHEDMGFHAGWGQCLDQLVAMVKQGG